MGEFKPLPVVAESMAVVVFLRAANVGGHNVFKPSELARDLEAYGVTNIGAAGTFVLRKTVTALVVRAAIHRHLPSKPEVIIRPAKEVLALVARDPFASTRAPAGARPFVSVLAARPETSPPLPLDLPKDRPWDVRLQEIAGRYALTLVRAGAKPGTSPNALVEKTLGVAATTRAWSTMLAIGKALDAAE